MADVVEFVAVVRKLYAPDSILWTRLSLSMNLARVQERYKFKQVGQGAGEPGSEAAQFIFSAGEFQSSEEVGLIQQLIVEANALQCQLATQTVIAEEFLRDVELFLHDLGCAGKPTLQEYARTFQTYAVARLDVPVDALFSEGMRRYLAEDVSPEMRAGSAEPHIRLANLAWQVSYKADVTEFFYQPRLLRIEPRAGSKLSDRLYFTQSPTNSETHSKLLERFEAALSSRSPVDRPAPSDSANNTAQRKRRILIVHDDEKVAPERRVNRRPKSR